MHRSRSPVLDYGLENTKHPLTLLHQITFKSKTSENMRGEGGMRLKLLHLVLEAPGALAPQSFALGMDQLEEWQE